VVAGGHVYLITDPSSETASDSSVTDLGLVFGATDNISGAPLTSNFYLATDNATPKWVRINSGFTLETLAQLPTAAIPTFTLSQPSLKLFSGLPAPTTAGGVTVTSSGVSNWYNVQGSIGGTATYDLTNGGAISAYNWANTKWLFVLCSPETISGGNGTFKIEIGNAGGTWAPVGTITDPVGTSGSPWCVFSLMQGLDTSVTSAVTQMRFTQLGPTTDPFSVSGFMPISTPPQTGEVDYYVTYYNSVTGAESTLSSKLAVVYNNLGITYPSFTAAHWNYNAFQSLGTKTANPDTMSISDCFNKGQGLALPLSTDFASVYTFSGTTKTVQPSLCVVPFMNVPDGSLRIIRQPVSSAPVEFVI
jgi:hypothetical protein